jgi:hypothetical protein
LTFSQRNIPFFRKQMALQIVQASMDVWENVKLSLSRIVINKLMAMSHLD